MEPQQFGPQHWIQLVGVLAACAAFASGLWQYRRAQQWKRAEFVASEIKAFEEDETIAKALIMLDHNRRHIQLFPKPKEDDPQNGFVEVTDEVITSALTHHRHRPKGFTAVEIAIRDSFDRLLDRLERFENFIQAGLVSPKEFRPYIVYWVRIMADPDSKRKRPEFYLSSWDYINGYGYAGVQRLFRRYGYDIVPCNVPRSGRWGVRLPWVRLTAPPAR